MKKLSLILLTFALGVGLLTFSAMKTKPKAPKMITQSVKMDPETGTITTVQVLESKSKASEEGSMTAMAGNTGHSYLTMDTPEGQGIIGYSSTPEFAELPGGYMVEAGDPEFDENNYVCFKRQPGGAWEPAECWWILAYF